jgi:hypothetical protein
MIYLFYISLFFLVVMLTVKSFGFSILNHEIFIKFVKKSDVFFHISIKVLKYWFCKIKFKNFHRLVVIIVNFIKREMIVLKRKFDSKQPKFFLKPQKNGVPNKDSVSFFLKNVSDYKDTLRKRE